MNARIVENLSNAEYHAAPGYSSSQLKFSSLAQLKHDMETPRDPTPAMREGTIVHTAVLEPENFDAEYIAAPKVDKRTAAGKAEWAAFLERAGKREFITPDEKEMVFGVHKAVHAHACSGVLEEKLHAEVSIFWDVTLPDGRVIPCKCRPDWIHPQGFVVDVKTTQDASPRGFQKSIEKFGYHISAAFYMDGCEAAGLDVSRWIWIAAEKTPPYLCAYYEASEDYLRIGREKYIAALTQIADAEESGIWPGYADEDVIVLEPSRWLMPTYYLPENNS